ncbi:unnamed protein product [Pylaiella littoralis]
MRRGEEEKVVGGDRQVRSKQRFKVSGTMFEASSLYELIKPVGRGAYGVVISALNTENGQKVAIKKVTRAFDDLVDAKRILREITLLRKFSHGNIISIVDILVPPSPEEFEDVYIVSDLMETDLHRIINSRQELTPEHVQYFLYQILRALKYMHSSNVLHRDLKPSNLLLNSNCDLKVCDLGLARDIESGCRELTEYVVTRWYRAPEIMLACQEYSKAIDVWSVGCIFAELMLRRPFFPGDNYIDQLTIICDKLGKPREDELGFVSTEKARRFIMKLSATNPPCLRDQFPPTASDEALDLLSKMLEFSPERRISVEDALEHTFMQDHHAVNDEPIANFEFCFAFEAEEPSKHRLQELMWGEMRRYHPEQGAWKGTRIPLTTGQIDSPARVFAPRRRDVTAAPLGRSPIKASPISNGASSSPANAADIPSDGGASVTAATRPDVERAFARPSVARPNESWVLASPVAGPTATPNHRTSGGTAAASASGVGGEGGTSESTAHPGAATVAANSTPSAAPPPRSDGPRPVPSSSSPSSASSSFPSLSGGENLGGGTPRARTRATAGSRVIKGRTTASASIHAGSTRSNSGDAGGECTFAADDVAGSPLVRLAPAAAPAAAVNPPIPDPIAANNRQGRDEPVGKDMGDTRVSCPDGGTDWPAARGALLPTRITQTESGSSSSNSSSSSSSSTDEACRQGAPVDGTSGFLSTVGYGDDPASEEPNLLGKRKMVHQAGRAGNAGVVVADTNSPMSSDKAT